MSMEAGIIFVVHTSGAEEKHLVQIFHLCFPIGSIQGGLCRIPERLNG